jgi:hypothetical protein
LIFRVNYLSKKFGLAAIVDPNLSYSGIWQILAVHDLVLAALMCNSEFNLKLTG